MPRAKNTTKETARKAITEIPARQRQAPFSLIEKWAETVCGDEDREGRMTAFILLLDEIERGVDEYLRVGLIVWAAQQSAFGRSEMAEQTKQKLIDDLRAKHGLRIVEKKRSAVA